jgi:molybdopterin biosynthesis enzyme
VQSRVNLVATMKGLLRVDRDAVIALNKLDGIAVFTMLDRLTVVPGKIVAGTKVTPVAIPEDVLLEAERSIGAERPVVTVKPFKPLRVGVITTEGLSSALQTRFRETVTRKIGWYGASVIRFVDLADQPDSPEIVASEIEKLISDGADVILTGGGNTIDPLDSTLRSLPIIGAEMIKYGAPAHPGSLFWLAYRWDVPIFNLASCSMYSKATVADLILPLVMAGERVTLDDLAELGYGGLLDRGMSFRFPPYDMDATEEPDEE